MPERAVGQIEVIAGGMFSGKSEELVRRLRRAAIARLTLCVFKPETDTRSSRSQVTTRDNRQFDATSVPNAAALRSHLPADVDVVGIDEAQFFTPDLADVVVELADAGIRVIVAGLDLDYLGRPFGAMPGLLAVADYVDKMHAICVRCGSTAQYSQRIAGGREQVLVGDTDAYEARCRRCYEGWDGAEEIGEAGAA